MTLPIMIASLAVTGFAAASAPAAAVEMSAAMQELRDRTAIHQLLLDYGRTIDDRDFDAFGALFAPDGEYGGAGAMAKGPGAIAGRMNAVFEANAMGFGEPNYHVFFNESIRLEGDRAMATSMSFFIVPGPDSLPRIAMMAEYDDVLVRLDGEWKFLRRVVRGLAPAQSGE